MAHRWPWQNLTDGPICTTTPPIGATQMGGPFWKASSQDGTSVADWTRLGVNGTGLWFCCLCVCVCALCSEGFWVLTDDVVILPLEELQAPQVGAELLELQGELYVLVRFDTVQQRRVGLGDGAALQLLPGNHVHLVVLNAVTHAAVHPRTHNVQLVPDLRVQNHALARHKSGRKYKNIRSRIWCWVIHEALWTECSAEPLYTRWKQRRELNYWCGNYWWSPFISDDDRSLYLRVKHSSVAPQNQNQPIINHINKRTAQPSDPNRNEVPVWAGNPAANTSGSPKTQTNTLHFWWESLDLVNQRRIFFLFNKNDPSPDPEPSAGNVCFWLKPLPTQNKPKYSWDMS